MNVTPSVSCTACGNRSQICSFTFSCLVAADQYAILIGDDAITALRYRRLVCQLAVICN